MAPDSTQPIELRIERTFDAPCETVFDAWIERDQASQWFGPEGFTIPLCEVDGTEGGSYRHVHARSGRRRACCHRFLR